MRCAVMVFKVLSATDWAKVAAVVPWSDDDRRDGFMHLSTGAQVLETATRHFAGAVRLVALEIDALALGSALRWEPSRSGALFPHLYGDLPRAAVVRARRLVKEGDAFAFADESP
jgi:uncharacterized protein (DUF952 family)